jgi:uncharacterized protein (TIGR02266 family)
MAQDTRKDPRAKVLTMTVRYKSATVDEFIEHHSHDVSRGGIYIKTPSPFLPGTLLKFEIRIADDKAMLQGVGRVVWKRDAANAGPEKPAGMGVKFIKVDEASRALIDRLVEKGGGESAYDAEVPAEAAPSHANQAAVPPAPRPTAVRPGGGGSPTGRPAIGSALRKGTMIGLGTDAAASKGSIGRPADPMFPKTDSEADMPPPEERTVMKQAAELLEEALRGAGGSMDELGSSAQEEPATKVERRAVGGDERKLSPTPPREAPPEPSPASERPAAARPATSPRPKASSGRPAPASSRPAVGSHRPAKTVEASAVVEPGPKKAGGKGALSLLLVAGAAAAAYLLWQSQAPEAPPVPAPAVPAVTAELRPAPAPTASIAAPIEAPAISPPPSDSAGAPPPTVAPSAAAAPSESAKLPAQGSPTSGASPANSAAAPTPSAAAAAAPPVVAPVHAPTPAPPPLAPQPVLAVPVVEKTVPPAAMAPKPKPIAKPPSDEAPKPAPAAPKPSDDNPY